MSPAGAVRFHGACERFAKIFGTTDSGERLISAIVPTALDRRPAMPAPLPTLAVRQPPNLTEAADFLLGMAHFDLSGRVPARALFRALGWTPGHRVTIDVVNGAVMIYATTDGGHTIGTRGDLALAASTRRMAGIARGAPVLLAASISHDVFLVYPSTVVTRLLRSLHTMDAADAC